MSMHVSRSDHFEYGLHFADSCWHYNLGTLFHGCWISKILSRKGAA